MSDENVARLEQPSERKKRKTMRKVPSAPLKVAMKRLGINLTEFADLMGVSVSMLSSAMSGKQCSALLVIAANGLVAELETRETPAERRNKVAVSHQAPERATTPNAAFVRTVVAMPENLAPLMRAHLAAFGCVVLGEG